MTTRIEGLIFAECHDDKTKLRHVAEGWRYLARARSAFAACKGLERMMSPQIKLNRSEDLLMKAYFVFFPRLIQLRREMQVGEAVLAPRSAAWCWHAFALVF